MTPRIPGGWYSDALPSGAYVVLVKDSHLVTDRARVELPQGQLPQGQNLLYVDLAPDGVRFAGVGHQDNLCWEWNGQTWVSHGVAFGPFAVGYDASGELHIVTGPPAHGWRRYPVTASDTYADRNRHIWEYTDLPAGTIGQGGDGPLGDDPAIVLIDGARRLIEEGRCRAIKARQAGGVVSIAYVREDTREAVLRWLTLDQLRALPEMPTAPAPAPMPVPVPVPVPVPQPTPEPPPMFEPIRLPDAAQAIVDVLYRRHVDLARGDDDQRRQLTSKIAESVRFALGPEWGWKRAGGPPSKDSIAKRAGAVIHGFDLFNGATREPNDHPTSVDISAQTFIEVAPVDHVGAVAPVPDPGPTVPDPGTPAPVVDVAAVLVRLDALAGLVAAAQAETRDAVLRLAQAVEILRTQPAPAPVVAFPEYVGKVPYLGSVTLKPVKG